MKTQRTITTSLFQKFVILLFVAMNVVFLTVPYVLSRHPGEPVPAVSQQSEAHQAEAKHAV